MLRSRTLITYLGTYSLAVVTVVRYVDLLRGHPYLWPTSGLLALIFVLMAVEPWIFRCSDARVHLYLTVQTGLIFVLATLPPPNDLFAILFVSLSLQAMNTLGPRRGFRWVSAFAAVMGVLMIDAVGWIAGVPLILIYAGGYLFFGSYAAFIHQAETAREENGKLMDDLEAAHHQLQGYVSQAEELAAIRERNRLARDLHDSVSQTIFSMTMMAEAVRIVYERDPAQAASELGKLQALARSTLGEMRSLIFELRTSEQRIPEGVPIEVSSTTGGKEDGSD